MKRLYVMALSGAAALAMTSSAWAYYWSAYNTITILNTAPGIGYRVYTASTTNPASCANTGRVDPSSTTSADQRELMDKTLLAAFLAGRKVKMGISDTACTTDGYPIYLHVQVDKDQ